MINIIINNSNNYCFIKEKNIDFFIHDLIDFNLFFKKLKREINIDDLSNIKLIEEHLNKINFFNNFKRTKDYNVIYKFILNKNLVNVNVIPKNISIRGNSFKYSEEDILKKLTLLVNNIYDIFSIFNDSQKTKKNNIVYKENDNIDKFFLDYELEILEKIYKEKNADKRYEIKKIKSMSIFGDIDHISNLYNIKEEGIEQYIKIKKSDNKEEIQLLNLKKEYYIKISIHFNTKKHLILINKLINKYDKIKTKINTSPLGLINNISSYKKKELFRKLFLNKSFDTYGIEQINLKSFDVSIIWENFLELYIKNIKNNNVFNGNKNRKNKMYLFNNKEYELKYDLMYIEDDTKNIIDAKFKIPKKGKNNNILYDGNDIRQLYVYLDAYNNINATGMLIYPSLQTIFIDKLMTKEFSLKLNKTYKKLHTEKQNKKIINENSKLTSFNIELIEIDLYNIF